MIEIKNIAKKYGDLVILDNVNAVINDGDSVAIVGGSGSGKSTLLSCINALTSPTSGQIIFNGVDLLDPKTDMPTYRRKIGMVFQYYNLFEHLTVLENSMRPQMDLLGTDKMTAYKNAMKYLKLVGMADRTDFYPNQLSGGQKQRAAIARALSMEPEIILFDEPTSALDPTRVGEVKYVIKKLKDMGKTMAIVTHDMQLAREVSNRVWFMNNHTLYEEGPTEEIFTNPKKKDTIAFIRKIKKLDIQIESQNFDYINAFQEIEQYCERIELNNTMTKKARLLFEEICVQTLMPNMNNDTQILVSFEYTEESKKLSLTIEHNGASIFSEGVLDPISHKLIENAMNDIEFKEISK